MKLYKGFVKNKGKKPVDKLKGVKEFRTLEEVKAFDSYGGVLSDDAILIDIDDQEQSEILMCMVEEFQLNCQVVCTDRGRHFTFRNSGVTACGTGKKLACGLTADIKVGGKNTVECLKIDGKERFVEWEFVDDDPSPLPKWLTPVKSSIDFFNMDEGEGRNQSLFNYILALNGAGFSKEEARECLGIINKYILKSPLSNEELETLSRDEAFPAEVFFEEKKFLHNNFANFIKNSTHIKRINGQLYTYKDGVYIPGSREIESQMVKYIPTLRAQQRVEVIKYLDIICPDNASVADANLIAFENGIYNVVTGQFQDFSPDIVITNKIPWEYDTGAYSKLADDTLNKIACNDKHIRALLEECIGYCFYRRNEMSKAFFLTGEGSNGKSTFLDLVSNVIGEENKSSLGLEELDERFSIATLSNKLANIGDDISDEFWQSRSTAVFRKLVSGNEVKAEFKGQDVFFMKAYTKFFFSANALPRIRSRGFEAIKRRLVIIPFNAKFSKDDPDYDPYITWKLRDEQVMKYMVKLGVEGLKRVLESNSFTESEKVKKELSNYELENNPILLFLQDDPPIVNQTTSEVYKAYKIFCIENGFQEATLSSFSKELHNRCGVVTRKQRVDGRSVRVYVKEENG